MSRPLYDPHRQADGVNRADRRLTSFGGTQIGDAVMCPACYGGGYVVRDAVIVSGYTTKHAEPVKCGVCKGEGLDPNNLPRSEG